MSYKDGNIVRYDMLKIERGKRKLCECLNPHYVIDHTNRLVECTNCGAIVEPYEALVNMANSLERFNEVHEAQMREREEVAGFTPTLKVIKHLNDEFGRANSAFVPVCPRCDEAFELSELTGGRSRALLKKKERNDG